MFCPRCEKEFSGSVRLCPGCFGELDQVAGRLPGPTYTVPAPDPARLPAPEHPRLPPPPPRDAAQSITVASRPGSPARKLLPILLAVVLLAAGFGLSFTRPPDAPSPSPYPETDVLGQARDLYAAGEYEAAAQLGRGALEALQAESADTEQIRSARELIGNACWKSGQYEEALEQYDQLPEHTGTRDLIKAELEKHNREVALARLDEGRTQVATGTPIRAVQLGEEALKLFKDNGGSKEQLASAHHLLGEAYSRNGDTEKASEHLRLARQHDPNKSWKISSPPAQRLAPAIADILSEPGWVAADEEGRPFGIGWPPTSSSFRKGRLVSFAGVRILQVDPNVIRLKVSSEGKVAYDGPIESGQFIACSRSSVSFVGYTASPPSDEWCIQVQAVYR
ncbi:MAG: tetratricopeptide repeat protein [Armatimonadetes bacterium]|nr:tetratricopeptide repeat protein [Armatimonadota bacterium]